MTKTTTNLVRRIIVPIDFSVISENALGHAVSLAKAWNAELLLLHVFEPPALDLPEGLITGLADANERVLRSAEDALASAVAMRSDEGVPMETLVKQGVPWRVIVETAGEREGTLVVMSTHGRTGLARALMGSVAEKVVRMAPCPVLTVPGPRGEI